MLAVLDGKTPEANRKQEVHLQAANVRFKTAFDYFLVS